MRKLNIGPGGKWRKEGWETLDNARPVWGTPWEHYGSVWQTGLPDDAFEIVFISHVLEHVPHFRIERTLAEINRVMNQGGLLRIAVPDLQKAVAAYHSRDLDYFSSDAVHGADHLGRGGLLLNHFISPGHQTFAFNRDFTPIGCYAHTYGYDFEMFEILLAKWGFGEINRSEYCQSSLEELRAPGVVVHAGKSYLMGEAQASRLIKEESDAYMTDFDNKPRMSLYVEARKLQTVPYSRKLEFPYTQRSRLDDEIVWRIKAPLFRLVDRGVDSLHACYKFIKRKVLSK